MLIEEYYLDWEDDIERHPGVKPLHSYLFVDDYFFCLKPQPGRRLGQAEVSWYFEQDKEKWRKEKYGISLPLANSDARNKHDDFLLRRRNKVERLNNILVSMSASVMDNRIPVVSVGSYAIPSRLKQLYESDNVSANSVIPVFQARLHGFNMVYANNITKKGAIRTVPVYSKSNTCIAHAQIMFMNIQQIALLQGNDRDYRLVEINAKKGEKFQGKYLEVCDSGEILYHFYLYSCDDDPLTLPTSPSKWVIPPLKVIEVDKPQLPDTLEKTQSELLRTLIDAWSMYASNLMNDEEKEIEGYRQASTPKSLRKNLAHEKVNKAFIEFLQQNCTQKNLAFEPLKIPETDIIPSDCLTYEQIPAQLPSKKRDILVGKTDKNYPGDFVVLLNILRVVSYKGTPTHILVSRLGDTNERNAVIAKYEFKVGSVAYDAAHVSMTIRNAIGLEVGENMSYEVIHPPIEMPVPQKLADRIIPRRYLITRLQRSEPTIIEIGSCFVQNETLQLLGIEPGDYVVLEGGIDEKKQICTKRLRAYPIPADLVEQRKVLEKNIDDALFPDCSERLGVFPDLDPILLDEEARKDLNLELCSPVRIRASRGHQLSKETRNLLLAFILALIGAVGIFTPITSEQTGSIMLESTQAQILFFVILLVVHQEDRQK